MRQSHFDRLELWSPADTGSEAAAPAAETPNPTGVGPGDFEQEPAHPGGEPDPAAESVKGRGRRRILSGKVVSDGRDKTITVRVERIHKHLKYEKYIRDHKKYHAHDEENAATMGDVVEIRECRPLSKIKRWRLIQVIRKAETVDGGEA